MKIVVTGGACAIALATRRRALASSAVQSRLPRSTASARVVDSASIVVMVRPGWTDWLTAIGTVAVAIAAVGVALFAERRAGVRVAAERENAANVLADERPAADARLKAQLEHSDAQLQGERQVAQDKEQLAEAYAIQVVMGERAAGEITYSAYGDALDDDSVKVLAVMILNRGRYTITRIQAQFSTNGNLIPHHQFRRLAGFHGLPDELLAGFHRPEDDRGYGDMLAPGDTGMRFESDSVHVQNISGPYPVVRWTDHWASAGNTRRATFRRSMRARRGCRDGARESGPAMLAGRLPEGLGILRWRARQARTIIMKVDGEPERKGRAGRRSAAEFQRQVMSPPPRGYRQPRSH